MTPITAERRPGGDLLVTGLLSHSDVLDALASLLVDPEVLEAAANVEKWDRARMDVPPGSLEDGLYVSARSDLAALLASVQVRLTRRDLEPLLDAIDAQKLVDA
jgi:hypothetical protein